MIIKGVVEKIQEAMHKSKATKSGHNGSKWVKEITMGTLFKGLKSRVEAISRVLHVLITTG